MEDCIAALRVLVVEDQAESRAHLRFMLLEFGITEVYEAGDGSTGLGFVDGLGGLIDIVLCDWNMPNMSGIEFLQAMRKRKIMIPFLMMTGRGDHLSVATAKELGVSGYLRKPFTPVQLEARLRMLQDRTKTA